MAIATRRRIFDDGRPRQLWRAEPEAGGFEVATSVCSNPECGCRDMYLEIRGLSRVGKDGARVGSDRMRATYSADAETVEIDPTDDDVFSQADVSWVLEQLRGDYLPWLRERSRRAIGQREGIYVTPSDWEPGVLAPFVDVFPEGWDLLAVHEGRLFGVLDQYCLNADCSCDDVHCQFVELGEAALDGLSGEVADGHLQVSLAAPHKPKVVGPPTLGALWGYVVKSYGVGLLRERHRAMRRVAADIAPARAPVRVEKVARNEPCPCGSGKKYKRCCLREDRPARA